jgi:hypothetical protein
MKLTWKDLFVDDLSADEVVRWFSPWSFLIQGRVAPLLVTKFGSWYFERPDGTVDLLDVLSGEVRPVARGQDEFRSQVNSQAWQEIHLLSRLVYELLVAGKVAGRSESYSLIPHPVFGGANPNHVDEIDLWQSICRQSLGGPA